MSGVTRSGITLDKFTGATVRVSGTKHAIRAQELARWLRSQAPRLLGATARSVTGNGWEERINGSTGILYFENYWLRPSEETPSGDHIDLWNGSRLTASGFNGALVTAFRFGLGVTSGPAFYDLSKSMSILFWDIK